MGSILRVLFNSVELVGNASIPPRITKYSSVVPSGGTGGYPPVPCNNLHYPQVPCSKPSTPWKTQQCPRVVHSAPESPITPAPIPPIPLSTTQYPRNTQKYFTEPRGTWQYPVVPHSTPSTSSTQSPPVPSPPSSTQQYPQYPQDHPVTPHTLQYHPEPSSILSTLLESLSIKQFFGITNWWVAISDERSTVNCLVSNQFLHEKK